MSREQDRALAFLKADHGECVVATMLDHHPLAQEFALPTGSVLATFKNCRFIIESDGSFIPIPKEGNK